MTSSQAFVVLWCTGFCLPRASRVPAERALAREQPACNPRLSPAGPSVFAKALIRTSSQKLFSRSGWIAVSSPAMTAKETSRLTRAGRIASSASRMPSLMLTRITCRSRISGNGRRARTAVAQDQHEETPCGHLPGLPRHERSCAQVSSRPSQRCRFHPSSWRSSVAAPADAASISGTVTGPKARRCARRSCRRATASSR